MAKRKYERIPILLIYKEGGMYNTKIFPDTLDFELYGFLKLYLDKVEQELYDNIQK